MAGEYKQIKKGACFSPLSYFYLQSNSNFTIFKKVKLKKKNLWVGPPSLRKQDKLANL